MIANLVSGLLGALLASLLTVLYLWVAEVRKLRGETFVEVATFLDETWQLVQNIQAFLDLADHYAKNGFPDGDTADWVQQQSRRNSETRHKLTQQINSSRINAKLAYVYGEGIELKRFAEVTALLRPIVTQKLSRRKVADWSANSAELHEFFKSQLDPARARLERQLMTGTRIRTILTQLPRVLEAALKPEPPND